MNPSSEEALFTLALSKPAAKRAAWLDAECDGDAALRQHLEALLAAHDAVDSFLEPENRKPDRQPVKTIKLDLAEAPDEAVGQTLGRYKLLERVGEGGCGVVYVAEQTEPVRRRVALKVIKLGMDTKQVVARFEAERQALAMMDHPNIAKVLDAGTTDVGRPFFVMELVRGIKITDYCDQAQLSTKERLDLFIKVCQAIQHAHQKGIIHRDIKPGNILVTLHDGVPVPKVIDFGIAKATEGRLTDNTVYTQLHQFIGTPAYMSPEQAEMSGLDIDTRSDIYSLGVLLYELLAGSTPFDAKELMASGIDAMRKTIREREPVRPSTRLTQALVAAEVTRRTSGRAEESASSRRRLQEQLHQLKGDLDWIVMKCLEKDRTRRYDTANGLAFDLKRHLNNEPVLARPPSAAYKFQKAFRRNKLAFTAGIAIAAVLLLGIIVSTWQSVRATRAKREALAAQAGESVQRQKAEANEQQAIAARAKEAKLRQQAEADELAARQRAYASDMNVAKQQLDGHNLGRALELLERQIPEPGQRDLRGWEWRYLWQQTRSDASFTLGQESSEILSLSVSPDGNLLAVGINLKGGVAVWDLRTRQELARLVPGESYIWAVFSPTEPLLAIVSRNNSASQKNQNTLRLWHITTRQMVGEWALDGYKCIGLKFAADGRTLMTATGGGHITLWRVPSGERLASYDFDTFPGSAETRLAATAPLSLVAMTVGESGRVRVSSLGDGKEVATIETTNESVGALAFSPDGKTLACADRFGDFTISLWDVESGKQTGRLPGHGAWVTQMIFSPDGRKLFSASTDQTVRVWDVSGQKCVDELRGHRQEVWRLAMLPDGRTLVSGAKDGTVCFWDTSVNHMRQQHVKLPAENVFAWSFSPDGQSVLTLDRQGGVMQWSGAGYQQGTKLTEVATNFYSAGFSPKGELLAVCWTNGLIQLWNPSQRTLVREWSSAAGTVWPDSVPADGERLIVWHGEDNLLRELDAATGAEIQSWPAPPRYNASALSPDTRWHIALGYAGDFTFKNLAGGNEPKPKLDFLEPVHASFSPDGKQFAQASALGYVSIWDCSTWQSVAKLGGFLNSAKSVGYMAADKRLVVASNSKEAVRLYDTESWHDVLTLGCDGSGNLGAFFSPDGQSIVWGNTMATLYAWHAPTWEEIKAAEAKQQAESKQP